MHPILLEIGPIIIYSMWFMTTIGIVVAGISFIKLSKEHRLKLNFILDHSFGIIISGIIGARFLFILKNLGYYFYQIDIYSFLSIFYIWDKGLSAWGGIIGILLAIIYFCKKENRKISRWMDVLFISVMIGMVFGNLGTFLEGSINYGKETALPWGVKIEGPTIKYTIPIHPTQLYAAIYTLFIATLGIFAFIKRFFQRDGDIFVFGTLLYAFLRLLEEFLRGDDVLRIFGIREGQAISGIIIIIIGLHLLIRYNKIKLPKFKFKKR
jgi:phosphatidylglycerol---prolipoprotein diacylglyceryl transferase